MLHFIKNSNKKKVEFSFLFKCNSRGQGAENSLQDKQSPWRLWGSEVRTVVTTRSAILST